MKKQTVKLSVNEVRLFAGANRVNTVEQQFFKLYALVISGCHIPPSVAQSCMAKCLNAGAFKATTTEEEVDKTERLMVENLDEDDDWVDEGGEHRA